MQIIGYKALFGNNQTGNASCLMTGGSNRPGGRRFPDNFVVAEPTLRPLGALHPKTRVVGRK